MKKVFFLITSSDFGGAETLLQQIAVTLDKSRYQVLVCSVKPKGAIARKLEQKGIRVESLEFDFKRQGLGGILPTLRLLLRMLKDFKPDILHASLFQADLLAAIAGVLAGVPARVATVHMVLKNKWPQLILERLAAPALTRYVAVSNNIRDFYIHQLLLSERKISVIHNVVDAQEVLERAREIERMSVTSLPRMPWVACVGRLDNQKGLNYLLAALKILKDRASLIGAVLVGDGPEKKRLEDLALRLGIQDRVYFTGFQTNPIPFIAQSQALVMSSNEEGLPFVLLEAMALGKAVISTAVGAIPEVVSHNRTGILVPPKNPEALAEAIFQVVSDQNLAQKLGKEGQDKVRGEFSIERAKSQLEALYSSL